MYSYQLNPDYLLRQDGNRVILYSKRELSYGGEDWFTFIHPFQAMMLSFFNGENPLENEIANCARFFNIPFEKMHKIILPFIENKEMVSLRDKQGHCVLFPREILVKKAQNVNRQQNYCVNDFRYIGTPNYKQIRLDYPVYVNMELIMKCYTDCCYCYANRKAFGNNCMPTQKVLDFIQECYDNGVLEMDINGGEVLLHPGIFDILKKLIECHYSPLISTKMPIGKKVINRLKSIGIQRMQISLDSVNKETLHAMLHVDMNYLERMKETLSNLQEAKMRTNINVVITRYNCSCDNLQELFDFIAQYDNIREIRVNPCGYSLYKNNFQELSVKEKDFKVLEAFINSIKHNYPKLNINISGYDASYMYDALFRKQHFCDRALCTGNVRNVVLLPTGDITICEELYSLPQFVLGNINDASLRDIWNSDRAMELYNFSQKGKSESQCYTCKERNSCRQGKGVCWKTILMAYGMDKWDFPDPRCPKAPIPYNKFYLE